MKIKATKNCHIANEIEGVLLSTTVCAFMSSASGILHAQNLHYVVWWLHDLR